MSDDILDTQREFLTAAGDVFGIPREQLMDDSQVRGSKHIFELVLVVALTQEDLVRITARMQQNAKAEAVKDSVFVLGAGGLPKPTRPAPPMPTCKPPRDA